MVTFLTGNYLLWSNTEDRAWNTIFDGGTKVKQWQLSNFEPRTITGIVIENMTPMFFGGTFQGIIFHLNVNELPDNPVIFEFQKTTGGGSTIVNTGVQCVIERTAQNPLGTGFFYSNTDIAEFTRTWEKGEFIAIKQTKTAQTSFAGSGAGTLMICLDLDLPPPVIPP